VNEDSLWTWLRDIALPNGHYSRIESAHTSPGFPDVTYTLDLDTKGTIELKYSKNLEIPFPGKPGLRKTQISWIRKEIEFNGYVWVIAEAPPEIYVIDGRTALESFNGATREKLSKISVGILDREDPKNAHYQLHNLLTTWRYDK